MARAHTAEAIQALVECLKQKSDKKVRVVAAQALLDRAWGKPQQAVELSGSVSVPLSIAAIASQLRLESLNDDELDALDRLVDRLPEGVDQVGLDGRVGEA